MKGFPKKLPQGTDPRIAGRVAKSGMGFQPFKDDPPTVAKMKSELFAKHLAGEEMNQKERFLFDRFIPKNLKDKVNERVEVYEQYLGKKPTKAQIEKIILRSNMGMYEFLLSFDGMPDSGKPTLSEDEIKEMKGLQKRVK